MRCGRRAADSAARGRVKAARATETDPMTRLRAISAPNSDLLTVSRSYHEGRTLRPIAVRPRASFDDRTAMLNMLSLVLSQIALLDLRFRRDERNRL